MATATLNYSSNTPITINLAGLLSQDSFITGRQSTQIDNTTNKYIDCLVSGFVSVGTTPTANRSIGIYVYGADTSVATANLNNITGTDLGVSLTNVGMLYALRLGASIGVPSNASDLQYPVLPFSVAALFGGVMPKFWGLYVAHNTVAALRNTSVNTNNFEFVGIKYDVA